MTAAPADDYHTLTMDIKKKIIYSLLFISLPALVASCARMGAPDGGWYDETPPKVVRSTPGEGATDVTSRNIAIYFNEFIKLENPSEKVIISPPQQEQPVIKTTGKHITIQLKDSLKANTTYTIDFADAISDYNENNPMGNYTYTFSTGKVIDTLQVSGYVLDAENLEPIKGILVGLFEAKDSITKTDSVPFARVSRTDSRGYYVIKGVAPGKYIAGAVMDVDGDLMFTQPAEKMAFSHEVIEPSSFMDTRQDTIWADAIHIKDIIRVPFRHFTPDNIVLRAFDHQLTERHFLKHERKEPEHFTLFFTAPISEDSIASFIKREGKIPMMCDGRPLSNLPHIKPLNFKEKDAFIIEPSLKGDTVTYWLRDTALVNKDTLQIEMMTLQTDTAGILQMQTDTLEILPKVSYAKRLKAKEKEAEEWQKKVEKKKKRLKEDEVLTAADTIMPIKRLVPNMAIDQSMTPDGVIRIHFPYPMQSVNTDSIHLYVEQDSLWYRAPFTIEPVYSGYNPNGYNTEKGDSTIQESINHDGKDIAYINEDIVMDGNNIISRDWELFTDWIPGAEYSFEIDTLAFEDIYGKTSDIYKTGIRVKKTEDFSSLFFNIQYHDKDASIIVELLDNNDKPVKSAKTENGVAEFYYLNPGIYYVRAIVDSNRNGKWDTGNKALNLQPEEVYYYQGSVECKAKWDLTKTWNIASAPLFRQKPTEITKQKAEAAKQIQHRNADRAAQKGIEPPKK